MRNININLALYSPFLVTAVSGSVVLEEKSSGYIHILRNIFQVSAFQVSAFQVSAFQVLNFCAKLSRFCFEIFWKYSLKSQKNRASLVITFINRLIFYAINFLRKVQKIFCEMLFKFLFSTNNFLCYIFQPKVCNFQLFNFWTNLTWNNYLNFWFSDVILLSEFFLRQLTTNVLALQAVWV